MPARRVARPLCFVPSGFRPAAAPLPRDGLVPAFPRTLTIPFTCTAR